MESIIKLINICNEYKNGDLNIEEFQHEIELIILPDECKNTLEIQQHNACNELEKIIYCYGKSQKKFAVEVADKLIVSAIKEKNRIFEIK